MAHEVFISYRRKDGADKARLLKLYLEACNCSVFLDQNDLDRTKPFPEELKEEISNCKDYILIWSDAVLENRQSDFLHKEMSLAAKLAEESKIRIHTARSTHFDLNKIDVDAFPEDFRETIRTFKLLTPMDVLDFKGDDFTIINALRSQIRTTFKLTLHESGRAIRHEQSYGYRGKMDEDQQLRLQTMSHRAFVADEPRLMEIADRLGGKNLVVLDVGCAKGTTAQLYFQDNVRFGKIIGIDRNPYSIEEAKEQTQDPRFVYENLDIAAPEAKPKLQEILWKHAGKEKVDIVFCSHVLQHVPNALETVRLLVTFLKDGGCFIATHGDDGSKIGYPLGENGVDLIASIVELTLTGLPHAADTKFGRKVYSLLFGAGLEGVRVFPTTSASSMFGLENRRRYLKQRFKSDFAWRLGEFFTTEEDSPEEKATMERNRAHMQELLGELEKLFAREDYWYSSTDYFCYGFKYPDY